MRTGGGCRTVDREISRFPRKERLHMPGSSTTPDRPGARDIASVRVAFRARNSVGTRGLAFAAQWLAYALPYRRFVGLLTDANARLGADVDRYSFIVWTCTTYSLPVSRRTSSLTCPATQSGLCGAFIPFKGFASSDGGSAANSLRGHAK